MKIHEDSFDVEDGPKLDELRVNDLILKSNPNKTASFIKKYSSNDVKREFSNT